MPDETRKKAFNASVGLFLFFSAIWGLDNWLGSGAQIRKLREDIDAVDNAQVGNSDRNSREIDKLKSRINELEDKIQLSR